MCVRGGAVSRLPLDPHISQWLRQMSRAATSVVISISSWAGGRMPYNGRNPANSDEGHCVRGSYSLRYYHKPQPPHWALTSVTPPYGASSRALEKRSCGRRVIHKKGDSFCPPLQRSGTTTAARTGKSNRDTVSRLENRPTVGYRQPHHSDEVGITALKGAATAPFPLDWQPFARLAVIPSRSQRLG